MKRSRHEKIIELIQTQAICTQEDLAEKLKAEGFSVTQATVSRDIRELGLSKVAAPSGRQRYIALGPVRGEGARGGEERYVRVLREALSSAEAAGNILVLKTASGMAMAAACPGTSGGGGLRGGGRHHLCGCPHGAGGQGAAGKSGFHHRLHILGEAGSKG